MKYLSTYNMRAYHVTGMGGQKERVRSCSRNTALVPFRLDWSLKGTNALNTSQKDVNIVFEGLDARRMQIGLFLALTDSKQSRVAVPPFTLALFGRPSRRKPGRQDLPKMEF
jgi:hypothetical protein